MFNKPKLSPPPNYELNPQISKAIYEERKEISIKILAALVSNPVVWEVLTYKNMAERAVLLTDDLMEELNKPKEGKP